MAPPPPAGTATARKVASSSAPQRQDGARSNTRRAPLRVVQPGRGGRSARRSGRSRLLMGLSITFVVGSLLVVVVAQAMLANGQVRLSTVQHQLSLEQSTHRQHEAAVSALEMPSRIVSAATTLLHMVHPTTVIDLPYVSLTTPLPTPNVTPAPVAPPAASSTTAAHP